MCLFLFGLLFEIGSVSSVFGERSKRRRTFAQKFGFSVGRNDLFVRLPVRTVASLSRVPEVSFVSWGIRSSPSCKPDREFGGRSAVTTLYNLAWNSSVCSVRSLRSRKYEAGRTNSFCSDGFFVSILCLRSVLRQVLRLESVGAIRLRCFGLWYSVWGYSFWGASFVRSYSSKRFGLRIRSWDLV